MRVMALLDNCFFCSLSVAASVIGVYTLVAYIIAFLMETWWIATAPVSLPSPAYVLCTGYLIVSIFSGVLLRGLSNKNSLFLLEWLLVLAALAVPESVLVYFMSIHYWNIRSLYGLMELTCWVCRAIVNISGIICVQSLYSTWQEEKEVLQRLRDLNSTRMMPPSQRSSVVSGHVKSAPLPTPVPLQLLNNGTFLPATDQTLHRTASMMGLAGRQHTPTLIMPLPPFPSEFNASQFDQSLSLQPVGTLVNKSYSLMDLRSSKSDSMSDIPRKTMSVVDFAVGNTPKKQIQTQSLDRRILKSSGPWRASLPHSDGFYRIGRLNRGYYPPFRNCEMGFDHPPPETVQSGQLIYGRNINMFYPGKLESRSRQSVASDSDDYKKYRDIAL